MSEMISAISVVGFPIVCCLVLFYMNYIQDIQHKEEIKQLTEVVNNNTLTLQKLVDKIDGGGEMYGCK